MSIERQICPRCGGAWYPWPGSKLSTHARCHFTIEEQDRIFDRVAADPMMSVAKLARELDVSTAIVRAVLDRTSRRRGVGGRYR